MKFHLIFVPLQIGLEFLTCYTALPKTELNLVIYLKQTWQPAEFIVQL